MSRLNMTEMDSPIEGATPENEQQYKLDVGDLRQSRALKMHNHLSVMCMELMARARANKQPDPSVDPIDAIFFAQTNDVPENSRLPQRSEGVFLLNNSGLAKKLSNKKGMKSFEEESAMIGAFIEEVQALDPDIILGYEIQMSSWGYLIERGLHLNMHTPSLLSRLPELLSASKMDEEANPYGADHTSEVDIAGRIVLNVWRLMRSEVSMYSYTFENVMYHVLHERVHKVDPWVLARWWTQSSENQKWRVLEYFIVRVNGTLRLLEQLDVIGRTSELARIFGIQFTEVLTRGSQFRVESLMLRLAKSQNCVPVSPTIEQRAKMKAPEYIPLVMEPESRFYPDPILVLDFQSLYPSIIIAYNYCYTTCLGRIEKVCKEGKPYEFGCSEVYANPDYLRELVNGDHLNISPGGIAFVKKDIRAGILPEMLTEILDTRQMVKRSMKLYKDDKALQRVLHARQLGLKLIANVTYGYTSANFSGRMPCIEVGDSVVSKGRETLERAIKMINDNSSWNAKVVYGDTDSVFVQLEGRSKEEAFRIGEEMAKAVTDDNPEPIKLKFEKVYLPCILQTKKRYVGYSYETLDSPAVFDAKGIETVRRDGCPASSKILEKSLRILFDTRDASRVKLYVQRQFRKIMQNRASLQDLTFAKEFRGFNGYKPNASVPALALTKRLVRTDPRAIPRTGERVPYIIVHGEPGSTLIQNVRSPYELLGDEHLRPNDNYYIAKAIVPPLTRCFSLVGADVMAWYTDLPKSFRPRLVNPLREREPRIGNMQQQRIVQYFASHHCAVCHKLSFTSLCEECSANPQKTVLVLSDKVRLWDKNRRDLATICAHCTSYPVDRSECINLDCPVMYRRATAEFDAEQIEYVAEVMESVKLY